METLQRTANRGSLATGYDIDNSLKFEPDNTESLTKSAATGGDRKKATLSLWCKRTELTGSQASILFLTGVNGNKYTTLAWGTGDEINFHYYNTGSYPYNFLTDREFRDTSAWYHIVVAVDTTQSTASDRVKFYVNGVQETSFSTEVYPTQNIDTPFNNDSATYPMEIGNDSVFSMGGDALAGYLADYYLIDGQQLAPTEFGEVDEDSGIWIPKAYTGTFGNNGFYLDFENSGSLGADSSGNSNNFTPINITSADQATDTPTNNFCTWSPLWGFYRNSTISEGATEVAGAAGGWSHAGASMGVTNGRWYWEWKITSSDIGFISFSTLEGNLNLNQLGHDNSVVMGYAAGNLYTWLNGSQGSNESTGWGTWAVNDIIGIYLDLENSDRRFTLYKNGSAISGSTSFPVSFPNAMQAANGAGNIFPYNVQYENDGGEWNFGGYTTMSNSKSNSDANGYGSFVYSPVLSGVNYYALCTKNLAEYG